MCYVSQILRLTNRTSLQVLTHTARADLAIAGQRHMNAVLATTGNRRGDQRDADIDIAIVVSTKCVLLIQSQGETVFVDIRVAVPDLKPNHEAVNAGAKGRDLRGVFVVCHGITISTDH
jgi:hypothetical protein